MNAEQLVAWRWEHHVTQTELARHLGVSIRTIKRWERGAVPPPQFLRLALERLDQLLSPEPPCPVCGLPVQSGMLIVG